MGLSPAFLTVLAYARTAGAIWINFDPDAAALAELPVFEW